MSIKLTNSSQSNKYIKVLVYAQAGAGKTPFSATAPKPIFLDADRGLLSISHLDLPSIEINDLYDLDDALEFLKSKKGRKFETVIVDDFTEITELIVQDLEETEEDKWEVYAQLGKKGKKIIRKFKKLKMNVIFICKMTEIEDDGEILRRPKLTGKMLPEYVPFAFDEVFTIRQNKDGETYVLTRNQGSKWYAKDRSRTLKAKEKPNLTDIFKKIRAGKIIN